MKRKILVTIILMIAVTSSTIVYATDTSCIFHSTRSYKNENYREDYEYMVAYANAAYNSLGYTSTNFQDPSMTLFMSNVATRKVQLHYCHGNENYLAFDDVGLTVGPSIHQPVLFPNSTEPINVYLLSVDFFDWSDKKLITLASCESGGSGALDLNSLAGTIFSVAPQTMVVGWYNKFSNISFPSWSNNFHSSLMSGSSVHTAIEYANSKFYLYPDVKNIAYFANIDSSLSKLELATMNYNIKDFVNSFNADRKNLLLESEQSKYNITDINDIITQNNANFDLNNYEKIESEGLYTYNENTGIIKKEERYIDYALKIGDYITNSAYTVVLDENNNIKAIYDNTIQFDSSLINNFSNNFSVIENAKDYYISKAKENIGLPENIMDTEITYFYDLEENQKYACVKITLNDKYDDKIEYFRYKIDRDIF